MTSLSRTLSSVLSAALRTAAPDLLPAGSLPLVIAAPAPQPGRVADYGSAALLAHARRAPSLPARVCAAAAPLLAGVGAVTAAPSGHLNFTLDDGWLRRAVAALAAGLPASATDPTAPATLIDFASPNVGKELHAGHLRSAVIGDTLARVLEFLGPAPVLRVSHVGDCGLPAALLLSRLGPRDGLFDDASALSPRQLSELYVDAKRRVAASGEEAARVGALLCELQGALAAAGGGGGSGNGGGASCGAPLPLLPAWAALCAASRRGYAPLFERLGVAASERGEACYAPAVEGVLRELRGAGVAVEDAGALVVRGVGAPCEPPFMVRKANGGFLYASVDLACLRERLAAGLARVVYVTDAAQAPHFRALFNVARAAGWVVEDRARGGLTNMLHPARGAVLLQHAAFGVVTGEGGKKLSSREGTEMTLAALLDEGAAWARRVLEAGTGGGGAGARGAPPGERAALAAAVSASAIRFFDLAHKRDGGYAFSMERAFSLKGGSAAYPLYALARLRGVREAAAGALNAGGGGARGVGGAADAAAAWAPLVEGARARARDAPPPPPLLPLERELALATLAFRDAVEDTARTLQPHLLAGHVLATASAFHAYYTAGPRVLADAPGGGVDWQAAAHRLELCAAAEVALRVMLQLCGVAQVERM